MEVRRGIKSCENEKGKEKGTQKNALAVAAGLAQQASVITVHCVTDQVTRSMQRFLSPSTQ